LLAEARSLASNNQGASEVKYATIGRYHFTQYFLTRFWQISPSPCDLCGTDADTVEFIYVTNVSRIVRCTSCHLEFIERIPPGGIDVFFDFLGNNQHTVGLGEQFWGNPEWRRGRHATLTKFIGEVDINRSPVALEIGCGSGEQLVIVRDAMKWQVVGTEIGDALVRRDREQFGLDLRTSTLEDLEFGAGQFDAILAFHVLEHLQRPSLLFEKARRWLKPSGRLVIEVPSARLRESTPVQRRSRLQGYFNIHHTHFFNDDTFARYCDRFGFKVIRTNIGYDPDDLLIMGYCCELNSRPT
jgi:SAM-dependent methyltransferase